MHSVRDLGDFLGRKATAAGRRVIAFFRPAPAPMFPVFGPDSAIIDHRKIIERLRKIFGPLLAGRKDAISGDPNLNAGRQGKFDFECVNAFQKGVAQVRASAEGKLLDLDREAKRRLPAAPEIDADLLMMKLEAEQEATLHTYQAPLVDSTREVLGSRRRLLAFRYDNPPVLFRPVAYRNRMIAFVGIMAVGSLEMLMNYVQLTSSGGRTGGELFMMVCATALINLSLGLLGCGFIGARNCGHVKVGRKIFGGVVLALSASAIILLHFALAHYRNALDILAADGAAAANADVMLRRLALIPLTLGETVKTHPWAFLGNIHSLTVFLAGIGFAVAAGCEGYWLLSDCYPGFEAADRIYRNALETLERQKRSFADAIAETVNEVRNLLDSAVKQGQERLNVAKTYVDRAREITRRYEEATLEIEYAMLEIIDEYRSHYIQIRDTAGPVQWEGQEPRLDREASFNLDGLSQIEESEAANLNGLRHNADEMKIRLTVSQTLLNNQLKTYLENVDQDAKRHEEMAHADLNGVRTPPPPSGGRKKKSDVQPPKL